MQIHVARDGKELGSFPAEEVRAGLAAGRFQLSDFVWTEEQSDWVRLSALPGFAPANATPLENSESSPEPVATALPAVREMNPGPLRSDRPTSRLAVASLVLGVLSLSLIPLLPSLPAIICGHLARPQIRRSAGGLSGDGLALCGLITGYLSLFVFGLVGAIIWSLARGRAHS